MIEQYVDPDTNLLTSRMAKNSARPARLLNPHGLLDGSATEPMNPGEPRNPFAGAIDRQCEEVSAALDGHIAALKGIAANRMLAVPGRQEATAQLQRDTGKALDKLYSARKEGLTHEINKGTQALPKEPPRPKPEQHALAGEVRQRLLQMSGSDRAADLKRLADNGADDLASFALASAFADPLAATLKGVDKADLVDRWQASAHPEIHSRLNNAKRALAVYESNHASAKKIAGTMTLNDQRVRL